ncbi:MAG: hypothetical protein GX941_03160 [Candidatus Methanofastidiosa archaeon]|nr:hypothetical protein [Candidatus Methanofastidiosa archaeon]
MSTTECLIRNGFRFFAGMIAFGFALGQLMFIFMFFVTPFSYLIPYEIHAITYSIILIIFMPLSIYAIVKSGKKEVPFRYMVIPFFVGIILYAGFRKYYIDIFNSLNMPTLFDLNAAVVITIISFIAVVYYMKRSLKKKRVNSFRLDNAQATVLIVVALILIIFSSLNLSYYNDLFNQAIEDPSLNSDAVRSSMAKTFWSSWFRIYSLYAILVGAVAIYENRKENKLIEKYTKLINIEPNNPINYVTRAMVYNQFGNTSKYEENMNTVMKLNEKEETVFLDKWINYKNIGDYEGAINTLNIAIDANPNYLVAYYFRGLTYLEMSHSHQAISDFTKVLESDKEFADILNIKGLLKRSKDMLKKE